MHSRRRMLSGAVSALLVAACAPNLPAVLPGNMPAPSVPPTTVPVPAAFPNPPVSPVVAPTAVPPAAASLRVVATFPAGTLHALRSGLRTLAAIPPADLSLADLQQLVITINGVVVPSSDIAFDPPTTDDLQQIVIRFTIAGRTLSDSDTVTIATPSHKLVLWGQASPDGVSVTCNVMTTAARLIREQMLALGRQAGDIAAEATERIAARLLSAMISSKTGDPTASPEMTYAVDHVAKSLINGTPITASTSLDRPSAGGGGGAPAPVIPLSAAVVTTLAGNGLGNVNGTGTAATFSRPYGVAVDPAGTNLYVADTDNHRIRKIVIATGEVTTLAGNGQGNLNGTGTAATFNSPYGLVVDPAGTNLYVADSNNHRIRKIVIATGEVTTFAGNNMGNGDGIDVNSFFIPYGIAVDPAGANLYVTDGNNHRIRKIAIGTREVTTLAGDFSGNLNGTGTAALFNRPAGIAVDPTGTNLYVADNFNHRIRKIVIGTAEVTTLAGNGPGNANGTGTAALFSSPYGVTVDPAGTNLYVTDASNNLIRKIVIATGVVTTFAGSARGNTDETGTAARFDDPRSIAINAAGTTLFIADKDNHRIRKIQ